MDCLGLKIDAIGAFVPLFFIMERQVWICGTDEGEFVIVSDELMSDTLFPFRSSDLRLRRVSDAARSCRILCIEPLPKPGETVNFHFSYEDIEIRRAMCPGWRWWCGYGPRSQLWLMRGEPQPFPERR